MQVPAPHKKQVAQAVQVCDQAFRYAFFSSQCDDPTFSTPAHHAAFVRSNDGRMSSWKDELTQRRKGFIFAVHPSLHLGHAGGGNGRKVLSHFGIDCGQMTSPGEHVRLDGPQELIIPRFRHGSMGAHFSNAHIEFIQCTVGFDAQVVFAQPLATKQRCGTVIPSSRVNPHLAFFRMSKLQRNGQTPTFRGVNHQTLGIGFEPHP